MVNHLQPDKNWFAPYKSVTRVASGNRTKKGRPAVEIRFYPTLFEKIRAEAIKRSWSFSRMVNHLCEASIDGIE